MRLKSLLLATPALSMFSAPVRADHHYVSLFGGMSIPETARAHRWGSYAYDISRDTGFVIGGALGTRLWSERWQGELELAYAGSDVSDVFARRSGQTHEASGDLAHLTLMANLWRDFAVPAANMYPYLGGGLGVALTLPDWCFHASGGVCAEVRSYRTSEPALAMQAGLGVRFPMGDRLLLDLGYRLRAVIGADMAGDQGVNPPGCCFLMGGDFITHSLQAGLSLAPGGIVEPSGEDESWYVSLFGGGEHSRNHAGALLGHKRLRISLATPVLSSAGRLARP
jgi:opacity protein-like surface antigen